MAPGPSVRAALAHDSTFAMAAHDAWTSRVTLHQPFPPEERASLLRLAERASEPERLRILGAWGRGDLRISSPGGIPDHPPSRGAGTHLLLDAVRVASGDFLAAIPHLERVVGMDSLGARWHECSLPRPARHGG